LLDQYRILSEVLAICLVTLCISRLGKLHHNLLPSLRETNQSVSLCYADQLANMALVLTRIPTYGLDAVLCIAVACVLCTLIEQRLHYVLMLLVRK
jgi:hypothetical protein